QEMTSPGEVRDVLAFKNDVLDDMYTTGHTATSSGTLVSLNSVVVPENANALYGLVRRERPRLVLEVGLGQGTTALAIASGLLDNRSGRLVSIDPFQDTTWSSAGVTAMKEARLEHLHTLLQEPDYVALPSLLTQHEGSFDFAYIDGCHAC